MLITIITILVTINGGLLANMAKTIPQDEAKQQNKNPNFRLFPSKNMAVIAQIAAI